LRSIITILVEKGGRGWEKMFDFEILVIKKNERGRSQNCRGAFSFTLLQGGAKKLRKKYGVFTNLNAILTQV
jgi:hypothetical protein